MKWLNFYEKTNKILENFYKENNIILSDFKKQENKINYIERTFFNCGSNLFIMQELKNKFDEYHHQFEIKNLDEKELLKKHILIKEILKDDIKHEYSDFLNKYFYSNFSKIDDIVSLKKIFRKNFLSNNSLYLKLKYILKENSPVIKGSIENFYPDIFFVKQFKFNINFNVVLGNIFIKILSDLNLAFLDNNLIIKLYSYWFEFYIYKLLALKNNSKIIFLNSENFWHNYFNNQLHEKRIKQAIENDITSITLKFNLIENIQNELIEKFYEKYEYVQNQINLNNFENLATRFSELSSIITLNLN